jgi:hypothetical protein
MSGMIYLYMDDCDLFYNKALLQAQHRCVCQQMKRMETGAVA